ncbi:unnamed protein product, partial [Polarella glacialis]
MRANFVCESGSAMLAVARLLLGGFEVPVDGEVARLELTQTRNLFAASADVLRFRRLECDLRIVYRESEHVAKVQLHHRDILSLHASSRAQEHYDFLHCQLRGALVGRFGEFLEGRLCVFDEICKVPVLLSVMACAFASKVHCLPGDIFELYQLGMLSTLRRRLSCEEQVQGALEMLRSIAAANHLARRRTFQVDDVRAALQGRPDLLEIWSRLLEEGAVPLVKILTLGDVSGEFQFSHLSFQEALFIESLQQQPEEQQQEQQPDQLQQQQQETKQPEVQQEQEEQKRRPVRQPLFEFWGTDAALNFSLNDPFYKNALAIGRGHMGAALARQRSAWCLDVQPRLSELGRQGLQSLLTGASGLRKLNVANVCLRNPSEMASLVAALGKDGLPSLEVLVLGRCQLPAASAQSLGLFLASCGRLRELDLEGNRELLSSPDAVTALGAAL